MSILIVGMNMPDDSTIVYFTKEKGNWNAVIVDPNAQPENATKWFPLIEYKYEGKGDKYGKE